LAAFWHLRAHREKSEDRFGRVELRQDGWALEALELTLLLADPEPLRYERATLRWYARVVREETGVALRESQAVLALLSAIPEHRTAAGGSLNS
jgi:hypothetical protein